jgi:hypothetical protein
VNAKELTDCRRISSGHFIEVHSVVSVMKIPLHTDLDADQIEESNR